LNIKREVLSLMQSFIQDIELEWVYIIAKYNYTHTHVKLFSVASKVGLLKLVLCTNFSIESNVLFGAYFCLFFEFNSKLYHKYVMFPEIESKDFSNIALKFYSFNVPWLLYSLEIGSKILSLFHSLRLIYVKYLAQVFEFISQLFHGYFIL